jgi:hypothetical protein
MHFKVILLGWHKPLFIHFTTNLNMDVLAVENAPSPTRTND